jgi:hypothetical protein
MKNTSTAMTVRVLLVIEAVGRMGPRRVSDLDLARLIYFTDAFSALWGLPPIDQYRLKSDEPRSLSVRRSLDRLVVSGIVQPSDVAVERQPRPHVSARYRVSLEIAKPVLAAIRETWRGRRETELVSEVVYASSGLLDGHLDEALRLDAGFFDQRLGPNDVIDLGESSKTSLTARMFLAGVSSAAFVEAELTHLYMAHLERLILND